MAGISDSIVQGLMNPAWAKGLETSIGGGMTNLGNAVAERRIADRNRNGLSAIDALLQKKDPNDPETVRAIQQVAKEAMLDPNQVNNRLINAQQRAKMDSRQEQAAKNEAYRMGILKENERKKKQEEAYQGAIESVMASKPKAVDSLIENLPPEVRESARQYVQGVEATRFEQARLRENNALAEGVDSSTLADMRASGLAPEIIAQYERNAEGPTKMRATKTLLDSYATHLNNLNRQRNTIRSVTKQDVTLMEGYIETLAPEIEVDGSSKTNWLADELDEPEYDSLRSSLAILAAQKNNEDSSWMPTKENISALISQVRGEGQAPASGSTEGGSKSLDAQLAETAAMIQQLKEDLEG